MAMRSGTRAAATTMPGLSVSEPDDARALAPAAALFHSLSDPTRLTIVQHLTLGEHRVRDLTEHLGLAQSTVSAHLACLRDCGLVTSRPQGRASIFSLATPGELLEVLAAAEHLLAATGDAVTLCPTYGIGRTPDAAAGPAAAPATPRSRPGATR